jgi:hypothetical protein
MLIKKKLIGASGYAYQKEVNWSLRLGLSKRGKLEPPAILIKKKLIGASG